VALSGDGNTAAVGGLTDNTTVGAVWIYTRSGGTWHQQQKLVDEQAGVNAAQGSSVALSADGNVALVGGYNDNSGAGAAWVWKRSGSTWTEQGAKLVGSGAVGAASQGHAVALSGDGKTAIVGGHSDGDNGNAGAAWIFFDSPSIGNPERSIVLPAAPPVPAIVDGRGP
jgi:hypothetical protein